MKPSLSHLIRVKLETKVLYCAVLLNGIARKGYINLLLTFRLWKENGLSFMDSFLSMTN